MNVIKKYIVIIIKTKVIVILLACLIALILFISKPIGPYNGNLLNLNNKTQTQTTFNSSSSESKSNVEQINPIVYPKLGEIVVKLTIFNCKTSYASDCYYTILKQNDPYKDINIIDSQIIDSSRKLTKGFFGNEPYLIEFQYPKNSFDKDFKSYYFNDTIKKTAESFGFLNKISKKDDERFKFTETKAFVLYFPGLATNYSEPTNALLIFRVGGTEKEVIFYDDKEKSVRPNKCADKVYCY
jgi:hypothetical protein